MTNKTYISQEDNTEVTIRKEGATTIVETAAPIPPDLKVRKFRKQVDLKKVPNQTDDTPKTKKRYYYEKTGNYVTYARAKQLGLVQ